MVGRDPIETIPIRGRVSIRERHSFAVFESAQMWGKYSYVAVSVPFQSVEHFLEIPVAIPSGQERLAIAIDEAWDSRSTHDISESPVPFPSLLLSARTNWILRDGRVAIFGSATVLDGARRLEALSAAQYSESVVLQIVFGLSATQEIELRKQMDGEVRAVEGVSYKLDTDAPRLVVKDRWVTLSIDSEPFVVRTARGYTPAVLVRPENDSIPHHLLIGAKSLTDCIEKSRPKGKTIVGLHLRIRKESSDSTSRYLAETIDGIE